MAAAQSRRARVPSPWLQAFNCRHGYSPGASNRDPSMRSSAAYIPSVETRTRRRHTHSRTRALAHRPRGSGHRFSFRGNEQRMTEDRGRDFCKVCVRANSLNRCQSARHRFFRFSNRERRSIRRYPSSSFRDAEALRYQDSRRTGGVLGRRVSVEPRIETTETPTGEIDATWIRGFLPYRAKVSCGRDAQRMKDFAPSVMTVVEKQTKLRAVYHTRSSIYTKGISTLILRARAREMLTLRS
jgi:hypothetical protein